MCKLVKRLFGTRVKKLDTPVVSGINIQKGYTIPKGWYVVEAGQNPLFMLWFVVLANFDDVSNGIDPPRHFVVEDCDSFEQALRECIKKCN